MERDTVGLDPIEEKSSTWTVSLAGAHQDRMRERLNNIEPAARAKIFLTASKILTQCPPPGQRGRVTGLALGKVQSGKTSSFIVLTAQAFDNGYRIVVVLAGTKNNLLDQNSTRIEEELSEGRERELTVLSTSKGTFRQEDVIKLVKMGRPVVITALKHHQHLDQVTAMFRHPDMTNLPVLIIDDEGDQASLNTKKRPKVGATNRAITDLRTTLTHHAFVAYTATPQAPLLIDTLDDLSPDFCVLVEPGPEYTGGSVFHGVTKDLYGREVPLNDDGDQDSIMQECLEKALATFFVGAVIRHQRKPADIHSMLVHTSHRQNDHGDSKVQVKALVEEWLSRLELPDRDPSKQSLLSQLREGYDDLSITIPVMPPWEEVAGKVRDEVLDSTTFVVNASREGQRPDPKKKMPFRNNIFIGGNMLDRGVTIPGLAVTVITRWSKENQADTVEQRARWFGYKQEYLDLCRVWAPQRVLDGFSALLGHEDDFWSQLRRLEQENRSVKEWRRLLVLDDPSLRPTRRNVASFVLEEPDNWTTQLRPALDAADCAANMLVVRSFFEEQQAQDIRFGIQTHKVVTCVTRTRVQSDLFDRLIQTDPRWTGPALRDWLSKVADKISIDEFDLIWVESDSKGLRKRSLKSSNQIDGHLQGESGARTSTYPGDKGLLPGRVQVQVHTPLLRKKKGETLHQAVLLAVHIPGLVDAGIRLWRNNG